jgi:UDP-N-acetylmuramoylalanine-D-glutamate ligase
MQNAAEPRFVGSPPRERPPLPPGPYLVVGLGSAGIAAASALVDRFGPRSVRACDTDNPPQAAGELLALRERGVLIWTRSDGLDALAMAPGCRCVVKSPGVPFGAPVLQAAAEQGLPIIDELELGWRLGRAPIAAVTGTNGKSTVCALVAAAAGLAGMDPIIAGNTMFGPPLSAVSGERSGLVVCEVSSYQLEGCSELLPAAAVLTNIGLDHLVRHGTVDAYAEVKRKLFVRGTRAVPLAVLNADDPRCRTLAGEVIERGGSAVRFGRSLDAEFRLLDCDWTLTSAWLEAQTPAGAVFLETRLPGAHNANNVLAALATCHGLGISLETTAAALERTPGVPGRFEVIDEGQPFDVIVDFAHSRDAIQAVLRALRPTVARRRGSRLHAMISASGLHTDGIRRPMGVAAGRLADHVIVTEGNQRGYPLTATAGPLVAGARSTGNRAVELIGRRRAAISAAVDAARPGDVVAILGRGAMPRLLSGLNGEGDEFDDRVVAREAILAR